MLTVTPIPAFNDNYLWLIENNQECWVVDPGDGKAVKEALSSRQRQLSGILVTHHHRDHIGGIADLVTSGMPVIGPSISPYELVNDRVSEGDIRKICGVDFQVLDVPGHTLNHVAYFARPESSKPLLFCGDTLFAGGCGRLFEGTPAQMHESLGKLASLDSDTLVYCAHEYTLANLAFCLSVEPDNQELQRHTKDMKKLREQGIPTLPSSIQVERQINVFLRADSDEVCLSAKKFDLGIGNSPVEVFTAIRKMKDSF